MVSIPSGGQSPRIYVRSPPRGGVGARPCLLYRPPTVHEHNRMCPNANGTPHTAYLRVACHLSLLSFLSFPPFLPSLSRPNSGYVYTLSSLLDRYSPLFLFSNQLLRTRRKKRKKRRKKKKRYIKGRYRSFFSSTRSPLGS